jgi:Ca2+-binding EF-hand superfamily protein
MHLGVNTWFRAAVTMFVVFEVAAVAGNYGFLYLTFAGWALWITTHLVHEHYMWVFSQLTPVKSDPHHLAAKEIEALQVQSAFRRFWRAFYHTVATSVFGESFAPHDYAQQVDVEAPPQEAFGQLRPGLFSARPVTKKGLTKHGALFLFRYSHLNDAGEQLPSRQPVAKAAAVYLRQVLLISSLYLTIVLSYHPSTTLWDWRVAFSILPIALAMVFVVPDTLAPMIFSISIEEMRVVEIAKGISDQMKLKKFANAANLLAAMQQQAKLLQKLEKPKKGESTPKKRASEQAEAVMAVEEEEPAWMQAKYMDEMIDLMPEELRKKAIELKEAFVLFDSDKSGELSTSEVGDLLRTLGIKVTPATLDHLVKTLDIDGSGTVSCVEIAVKMITDDEEDQEQMARNVFHMIDKNGKGAIQTEDLREAFDGVDAGLSEEDLMYIVAHLDEDDSGKLEEEEFVEGMMKLFEGES